MSTVALCSSPTDPFVDDVHSSGDMHRTCNHARATCASRPFRPGQRGREQLQPQVSTHQPYGQGSVGKYHQRALTLSSTSNSYEDWSAALSVSSHSGKKSQSRARELPPPTVVLQSYNTSLWLYPYSTVLSFPVARCLLVIPPLLVRVYISYQAMARVRPSSTHSPLFSSLRPSCSDSPGHGCSPPPRAVYPCLPLSVPQSLFLQLPCRSTPGPCQRTHINKTKSPPSMSTAHPRATRTPFRPLHTISVIPHTNTRTPDLLCHSDWGTTGST